MSPSLCKRPRACSAAGNAINSCSSTSQGIRHCLYTGCVKPPHSDSSGSERKFCCVLHCDLYMSNLAMSRSVSPSSSVRIQDRLTSSSWAAGVHQQVETISDCSNRKCMLPGCLKTGWKDFEFCGKKHMLMMVEQLTKDWSLEGRICKLEECCRHVYVEDDRTCYDYCGMKHGTLGAARKGATMVSEAPAEAAKLNPNSFEKRIAIHCHDTDHQLDSDVCVDGDEQRSHCSFQEEKGWEIERLIDSERGYYDKISDLELQRLLKGGSDDESFTPVQHGVDIYDFHPWELVKKFGGYRPRYFLHYFSQKREQKGHPHKRRKTKEGFSWKQSGPTHLSENNNLETRYLKYMLEKPEKYENLPHVQAYAQFNLTHTDNKVDKSGKRKGPKCRWKMHEITLLQPCQQPRMDYRKVVWVIFQEARGEPVWPPCRQTDLSEGIFPVLNDVLTGIPRERENFAKESYECLDPSNVPAFVRRADENIAQDSSEGVDTITLARADLTPSNSSLDTVLDPSHVADFQTTDSENDVVSKEAQLNMDPTFGWILSQLDVSDTQMALGLGTSCWRTSIENFQPCETEIDMGSTGSREEYQHPTPTDIGCLWMY